MTTVSDRLGTKEPSPLPQGEGTPNYESCLLSLTATRPSEIGGARATSRLDYQKNWTLHLILELHRSSQDYLIICDYFDDVIALLGQENTPPRMRFYQIKGARRHWTISHLTAQDPGADGTKLPSILGKLLAHYERFHPNIESVNFVSNQYVSVKLNRDPTSAEREQFEFVEILEEDRAKLERSIRSELGCTEEFLRQATLVFVRTPLSLDDHEVHARGYLEQFLRQRSEESPPIYSIHLVISDEILRRIKDQGKYDDIPSLTVRKGLSRSQFEAMLQSLLKTQQAHDPKTVVNSVMQNLQASGIVHGEKKLIGRDLMRFAAERALPERLDLHELSQACRNFLDWISQSPAYASMTYSEMLTAGCRFLRERHSSQSSQYADAYLKAIVSWEEYFYEPVSPSAAQHP